MIPTQASCNWNDPKQALLWACMCIPVAGKNPMVFPRMIGEIFSEHFDSCGFVHVDRIAALADENGVIRVEDLPKQTKKFVRPARGQQSPLNPLGRWVGMDEAEAEPVVIQDPAAMTALEREAQVERLRYLGYRINEPEPEAPKAFVVDERDKPPEFDPGAHSVTETNAHLRTMDTDSIEFARIIRAEKRGKNRNGILKRHQENV